MLNFPSSPTLWQTYKPAEASAYIWDGEKWSVVNAALSLGQPSDNNPQMDGVASAGLSLQYARGDHVHPSDTAVGAIDSWAFTGTLTAATTQLTGNVTVNGTITSTVKQHRFGDLGTVAASASMPSTEASLLFYQFSAGNWSGMGTDNSGNVWLRTGLSGSPAPSLYVGNDQIVRFANGFSIPTVAAGTSNTQLANTAFVYNRGGLGRYYPLAGGTVTGNVTIVGDMYVNNGGNYGVLYLGNRGDIYLQWDGSNYNLNAGWSFASNGQLYTTGHFNPAALITTARLAYYGDQNIGMYTGMTESYPGSYITGESGDQGNASVWCRRFRQMQYYTTGWFAIGYA